MTSIANTAAQHRILNQMKTEINGMLRAGRNDPCPCGKKVDGKPVKFKRCCWRAIGR